MDRILMAVLCVLLVTVGVLMGVVAARILPILCLLAQMAGF
ncbi:MAG: hypothetical protein ACI4PO_00225 [Faecousia sp.]